MHGSTSACTLEAHPWRSTAVDRYRTSPLLPRRNVTWTHAPPCGTLPPSHKCEREIGQRMALEQNNALGVFFPPSRERTLCGKKSTRFLYLDVGANDPQTSVLPFVHRYRDGHLFELIAFEGDPQWRKVYAQKSLSHVRFIPFAVGTRNGTVTMKASGSNKHSQAMTFEAAADDTKQSSSSSSSSLRVLDFAEWLRNNVRPTDFTVCKIDIERGEFELLPYLLTTGTATLCDELFMECHSQQLFNNGPHQYRECVNLFRRAEAGGLWVHEWF